MALYGLESNQTIIVPDQASVFLSTVSSKTMDRPRLKKIEAEVNSIQHKLNVIRYHAGLIQTLSENDFGLFLYSASNVDKMSYASYQDRCIFTMNNEQEYALFLTLFIETMSAGAFSLFDVCAHLITNIFDLPLPRQTRSGTATIDISYKKVLEESKVQSFTDLYDFLCQYRATSRSGNASQNQVSWIDPLEAIRHKITHKPITDIVIWNGVADVYSPDKTAEFLVHKDFFTNQPNGDELKSFARKCFDGIEEFVDELFRKLIAEINNHGSVPI